MTTRNHFRKVFKSDHLSVADLEDFIEQGSDMNFTISHVKQEFNKSVAGRKGDFNIAYFKETIKPLVLNATNSKALKQLTKSPFVEDWTDIQVNLWIDHTAGIGGNITGGVRINPLSQIRKKTLTKGTPAWDRAIEVLKKDGNLDKVKKHAIITNEIEKQLIKEAN